ncbi:MAG: SH3 beta-barrel fold-containing protein [Candidatus Dormibacteria bacterium]
MSQQFKYGDVVNTLQTYPEVYITFIKVDGTLRKMRCTLQPDCLPEGYSVSDWGPGSTLTEGDGVSERISVYDLDLDEWRSFRLDTLKTLSIGH